MDRHSITGSGLTATVQADGAELCSLQDAAGREMLWQAHPAWPRHAPVLFPIVGTLKDNRLLHRGRAYTMGRHGFARDRRFAWVERTATLCRLVLTDDAATRAVYPFAFRLEVTYAVNGGGLEITFAVTNTGDEILPASMGAHPAFNWPLRPGAAKDAHLLVFSADEPWPIRRVTAEGLLRPEALPSPIEGRVLKLHEGLFADDAIILDRPASNAVRFTAPDGPAIDVVWDGFPELGIWSRPGVDLLCIEPWRGMSSPVAFAGEFMEKPGLMLIPPGARRAAMHRISLG
ncbi:aldose 1-epimerase family protein [Limobrevibacterium gyesilva]|uniref:Aldose 1-epimerase family protein n=1 Tax=Limobrevibacterium gyesilva TaxID=2991712 RepID=A0AA41YIE2_9PROT|nr:aldose 1-epimerase family protein [Limobrevibacterium gyesilva]MCW3474111.1 aldose 1-epimerase family protein [Limobrevibacterium gyesilva]